MEDNGGWEAVSVSTAVTLVDNIMEAKGEGEHDLRVKRIWARRPLLVHCCGGVSVSTRSRVVEEAASEKIEASYLRAGQKEVRVLDGHGCWQPRVNGGNGASAWRKTEGEEVLVDSTHAAAVG